MLTKLKLAFIIIFLNKREMMLMVEVYATLIIYGRKTIDQVPLKQRQAVIDLLVTMGLDENGNPIETSEVK